MQVDIIIDERKLNQIQRMFATWPGRAKKIFKESINRTIEKMRTRVVSELNQLTGMKKKRVIV
jgi:surfactin synthase thioesterase subunit